MKQDKLSATGGDDAIFARVRDILESAKSNVARTVNTTQVVANWLIGREIVEEQQQGEKRAGYGKNLLIELSLQLKHAFGRGFSVDNLEAFRQFYLVYPSLISDTLLRKSLMHDKASDTSETVSRKYVNGLDALSRLPVTEWKQGSLHPALSWSHYRILLRIHRDEARAFYELETIQNSWTVRELSRQISSLLFDRLAKSNDKQSMLKLANEGFVPEKPIDMLKDPMVLEFLELPESAKLVESTLEQALIGNLQTFLLELGKGFAFVSRQERITLDGDHFYIDLVFYHTILKCFVLIDLKTAKLSHGDLGQIQFYVNYYNRERRSEGDNPTIGLVLCPDKNDAVVKYTLGEQQERNIFTSRYQLYLPSEEELKQELQRELRYLSIDEQAKNQS